jgi:hypothetical protein
MTLTLKTLQSQIHLIRGERVILAHDLARIYGVETRVLNQAVKRNAARFPGDFMFPLAASEAAELKSQSVTSSWGGARRALPYAFTEHGAVMAASVLNSPKAIQMSVYVVRAFVSFARTVSQHNKLATKLSVLESKVGKHDKQLQHLLEAIRLLIAPPDPARRKIKGLGK